MATGASRTVEKYQLLSGHFVHRTKLTISIRFRHLSATFSFGMGARKVSMFGSKWAVLRFTYCLRI